MMNVIIAEDLVDHDYVEKYTLGFEELKARAANYPPERVAEITGIPAADIQKLAREYATTQPSAIRQGVAHRTKPRRRPGDPRDHLPSGPGRRLAARGRRHRRRCRSGNSRSRFDRICRPDLIKPGTRVVNELDLGAALTGEMALDPPIKSLVRLQLQSGVAGAGAGQDRSGACSARICSRS